MLGLLFPSLAPLGSEGSRSDGTRFELGLLGELFVSLFLFPWLGLFLLSRPFGALVLWAPSKDTAVSLEREFRSSLLGGT